MGVVPCPGGGYALCVYSECVAHNLYRGSTAPCLCALYFVVGAKHSGIERDQCHAHYQASNACKQCIKVLFYMLHSYLHDKSNTVV